MLSRCRLQGRLTTKASGGATRGFGTPRTADNRGVDPALPCTTALAVNPGECSGRSNILEGDRPGSQGLHFCK
jgi:hypothetical protein